MRELFSIVIALLLSACASAGGPYPSLQPRAAEAIDPRVEPTRPINDRPLTPAIATRLAALVDDARIGETLFEPAAAQAERLAATSGPPQSESWIGAQEALSAAIAAGQRTATALTDIDAVGAAALQTNHGIAPNDLKAINSAAAEVSRIAQGQADRIAAIKRRLAL
jgi:hypothetical protein